MSGSYLGDKMDRVFHDHDVDRKTPLPLSGVAGLQGVFYIHNLFEIQDALKR